MSKKQNFCSVVLLFIVGIGCSIAETDSQKQYQAGSKAFKEGHFENAFSLYLKAAEHGLAEAQFELGKMYANGNGVSQDYKQALTWYRKAADQGYADAQNALGASYQDGLGTRADLKQAFEWYKKAAEQGNAKAQSNLGNLLIAGKGVEPDPAQAFEWYKKAAEQGNAIAQVNLAGMYIQGYGIDIDAAEGYKWLLIANKTVPDRTEKLLKTLDEKLSANDVAEGKKRASEWQPSGGPIKH